MAEAKTQPVAQPSSGKPEAATVNSSTGSKTVTVASKLPFDMIMRVYDKKTVHEPIMGGGVREYQKFVRRQGAKSYLITGNSFPQNQGPGQVQIADGYAITNDIPKDFWDEWLEQHKEADFIVNGMIFAHSERASTFSQAREMADVKTNLERLDPKNLPKGLQTSDQQRGL